MPHIPEHLLGDAFSKSPFDLSPGRAKVKRTLKSAGPQAPPPGAIPTNLTAEAGDISTAIRGLRGVDEDDGSISLQTAPQKSIFRRATGAISSAFGDFSTTLSRPETGKFLSQLGAAINPRSQVSAALGTLGTSLAEQRSETAFRERVTAGEEPSEITGGLTGALSSEQRSRLIGESLRGRAFGLEEMRVVAEETRTQTALDRFARGDFINISGTGKIFNPNSVMIEQNISLSTLTNICCGFVALV